VSHDADVARRLGRTVTIRDGRVGAEGMHGEEYAVVGVDGSIHLPERLLAHWPAGTLIQVEPEPDLGSARLTKVER
jgi:putative ABC transport system ATP-binding protein